jgi:uncharacterized protein YbjT (DUF2867 family)
MGVVLVTGGTGNLGRRVVSRLQAAGRDVRVLSRRPHEAANGIEYMIGDLTTGDGIQATVTGVTTIVHCAGGAKGDGDKARNLVRAASSVGVQHLVYISVVGADRIPIVSGIDRAMFGYFGSKLAAERVVAESGLHFQPVDAGEVAARLVELTLDRPSGLVPDFGGPRVYDAANLIREYLRARHKRRVLLPVRLPPRQGCSRGSSRRDPVAGQSVGSPELGRLPGRSLVSGSDWDSGWACGSRLDPATARAAGPLAARRRDPRSGGAASMDRHW